jgi:N-acetylglutamate synthase-like GNAT family acetyltransferase
MKKFRPAHSFDDQLIIDLLKESESSPTDLKHYLEDCVLAFDGTELIGVIGAEIHEGGAVLRSLAVKDEHRKAGLGTQLIAQGVEYCRVRGAEQIFIVVEDEKLGKKAGFETIEKSAVPKKVQSSSVFQNGSGKIMRREVNKLDIKPEVKPAEKAEAKK